MEITDKQIIGFIQGITEHGGEITIAPHDWLNPKCGYFAKIKLTANTKQGYTEVTGSADTGIESLRELIKCLMPG